MMLNPSRCQRGGRESHRLRRKLIPSALEGQAARRQRGRISKTAFQLAVHQTPAHALVADDDAVGVEKLSGGIEDCGAGADYVGPSLDHPRKPPALFYCQAEKTARRLRHLIPGEPLTMDGRMILRVKSHRDGGNGGDGAGYANQARGAEIVPSQGA